MGDRGWRIVTWLRGWSYDLRQCLASLVRWPGFVVTAVMWLALAIGAGSAAFAVVDAVRFRALPFPVADRLVVLGEVDGETGATDCGVACSVSYETYADVLRSHVFTRLDAVVAYTPGGKALDLGDDQVMVTGGGVAESVRRSGRTSGARPARRARGIEPASALRAV